MSDRETGSAAETVDWEAAEITLTPDPCWTPGLEAIAQSLLDLIRALPA